MLNGQSSASVAATICFLLALWGGAVAHAQIAESDDIEVENVIDDDTPGADELVQGDMDEWEIDDPRARRFRAAGLSIYKHVQNVGVSVDDPRWGQSRSIAYQAAFQEVTGEFVGQVRREIAADQAGRLFSDRPDPSELVYRDTDNARTYIGRIVQKLGVLAEEKLDRALSEAGLSEREIEGLTPPNKITAYSREFRQQTMQRAFGSAAGLIAVKTFERIDDKGRSALGVVAVYSQNMRDIAERIGSGQAILADSEKARAPIFDQLARITGSFSDDAMTDTFGVRVMWDEKGYPTVVSFGQWAWSPVGASDRQRSRRREVAAIQAKNIASAQMASFINSRTEFTNAGTIGERIDETINVYDDNTVSEGENNMIDDIVDESSKVGARVELSGMKTLHTWGGRHPDAPQHRLVGAIVVWSPALEDEVREMMGEVPENKIPESESRPDLSSTRQSLDMMDMSDF